MRKISWLLATALLLSTILAGCGGAQKTAPAENSGAKTESNVAKAETKISGQLMIYTSIYPDIIKLVDPELKKAFPDLKIEWFQNGTEKVVAKLAGEIEANKIGADLLMVADPSYYMYLKEKNLLMQYKPKEFDKVIVDKDAEGYYTGVRISNVVIAYNTKLVKPEEAPKSFKDLTDPKWKGQVVVTDPNASGTALDWVAATSKKYGWDFIKQLKANGAVVGGGNSSVQKMLIAGEYKIAIILEENILKVKDGGEPTDFNYPTDGTVVIPSPIAIFKSTQNPEAAKALTDWWLSKEGQKAVTAGWMHAVRADVDAPKGAKPFKEISSTTMLPDWVDLAKNMAQVKEEFNKIMGTK